MLTREYHVCMYEYVHKFLAYTVLTENLPPKEREKKRGRELAKFHDVTAQLIILEKK